jgi:hypothetical protein
MRIDIFSHFWIVNFTMIYSLNMVHDIQEILTNGPSEFYCCGRFRRDTKGTALNFKILLGQDGFFVDLLEALKCSLRKYAELYWQR